MSTEKQVQLGTAGGTIFSLLLNIGSDLLHTIMIAATGAFVSFSVSMTLQWLLKKIQRKKNDTNCN